MLPCDIGVKQWGSLGILTQHICYFGHKSILLSGKNFSVVGISYTHERQHLSVNLLGF